MNGPTFEQPKTFPLASMEKEEKRFRIIIVGGSVAGLTLAHCLEKSNIEYVILESHHDIAPDVGASIGIVTNGGRILDQLGIFDDILDVIEPLEKTMYWTETGKLIMQDEAPRVIQERYEFRHAI